MEEGSGGVGDLGQTAGPSLWALECCQPDLSSAAARAISSGAVFAGKRGAAKSSNSLAATSCAARAFSSLVISVSARLEEVASSVS